ncbi:unnamed protein product, partial [Prorocentrum cordatum]
ARAFADDILAATPSLFESAPILGPERGHEACDKALAKVLDRAIWRGAASGGLFLTTLAYTVCRSSVVGFLMHSDALPPRWASVEAEAFQLLVPGSSQWVCLDDLRQVRALGFPRGFDDLHVRCRAAQLRVATMENSAAGGRFGLPGCMFGCSPIAEDSIEHYANCQIGRSIIARELGLQRPDRPADRLASFLGFDLGPRSDESAVVLRGIRLAAMHRVHCHCRRGALRRGHSAREALPQACREVVRGHRRAGTVCDEAQARWRRDESL